MVLVDTNALSAMMRVAVDPIIERWFDAQPSESVWTTTISIFESRFGLVLLAPGHRRDRLYDAFDRAIDEILGGRVVPFDRPAAESAAAIAAKQRVIGRTVEIRNVQIAGIADARRAALPRATGVTSKTLASFSSIPARRHSRKCRACRLGGFSSGENGRI